MTAQDHPARTRTTIGLNLLLVGVSLLVAFLLVEGVARWHLAQKQAEWARLMQDERHYLRRSDDPRFGYEHDPGRVVERGGRRLAINAHGIRADSDELFPDRERIGLLGDSVTFGVLTTQELTLSARLEQTLAARGRDAAVINLGVGGYGLNELAAWLPLKDEIYRLDRCIYILNPNDFARRGSIYEGGDNGSYRMYNPPDIAAGWLLVKLLRRALDVHRDPVNWYRFVYHGNRENAFQRLDDIVNYARSRDLPLAVVLLPSRFAYRDGGYLLADQYAEIQEFLAARGVISVFPREAFGEDPERYLDRTDHLVAAGDSLMTEVLADLVERWAPAPE